MQGFKLHNNKDEVLVIGDIVLDCYVDCNSKYSDNEKVNKLIVKEKTYVPGNAANVANNIANLGISVHLFGVIGEDRHGHQLETLLNPSVRNNILKTSNRYTPIKTRYLNEDQEISARIDEEEYVALSDMESRYLFTLFEKIRNKIGYLIISDLNKGTFSHQFLQRIIAKAKEANIVILVDPSDSRELSSYVNCDFLFPNLHEFERLTKQKFKNLSEGINFSKSLIKELGIHNILLKADKMGSVFINLNNIYYFPSVNDKVICTIGAGDSFISGFVYSLIKNTDILKAFLFANLSSSISISKKNTATVEREELELAYLSKKVVKTYGSILRES